MSFRNLEERFNSTVNKLYAGATTKFDNGKPSNGRNDMPFIVRKPGQGQAGIRFENRSLPIISTVSDVKRLTLFTLRPEGLLFLAKQQLLQTGNTFQHTRIINPLFAVGNAVPFLHIKRNLRPLNELLKKTDTSYDNVKTMGQLQAETYEKLTSRWKSPEYIKAIQAAAKENNNKKGGDGKTKKNSFLSTIGNKLGDLKRGITSYTSAFNPFQARNIRDKGWYNSRPELKSKSIVSETQGILKVYQESKKEDDPNDSPITGAEFSNDSSQVQVKFIKYFSSPNGIRGTLQGKEENDSPISVIVANPFNRKKLSYIKDPLNELNRANPDGEFQANGLMPYRRLKRATVVDKQIPKSANGIQDPIVVSFAMGNDDHIQFRAFIKDIQQSTRPEYKEYQYIGRIEKFISYGSVRREVNFKLDLLAFGKDELTAVWDRINYLTGLVYPYGINLGVLQPNIVRFTIGNLYVNQPGYATSLQTEFYEPAPTWDLDNQIPIGARMNISFNIIEKTNVTAASPFYGITESDTIYTATAKAGEVVQTKPSGEPVRPLGPRINDNPINNPQSAAQNYFNNQPIFSDPVSKLNKKP